MFSPPGDKEPDAVVRPFPFRQVVQKACQQTGCGCSRQFCNAKQCLLKRLVSPIACLPAQPPASAPERSVYPGTKVFFSGCSSFPHHAQQWRHSRCRTGSAAADREASIVRQQEILQPIPPGWEAGDECWHIDALNQCHDTWHLRELFRRGRSTYSRSPMI